MTFFNIVQNDPKDLCEQAKHSRGAPQKCLRLSSSLRIGFYKVRKLYPSRNNGPIVQPMNQWGDKECLKVIW